MSQLRSAGHLFKTQCRQITTHKSGHSLIGDDLGPIRTDAHSSSRVRGDGKRKALPLPPLLDPVVLKHRSRWEQTKRQSVFAEFTPFQKRLWENAFAHALASPVRQCRTTLILLPCAFLTSLHPRPHPTTSDPWLVPVSLTTDERCLGPVYRFIGRHFVATQLLTKKSWRSGLTHRFSEKLGRSNLGKIVWREGMADLILELMRKRLIRKLSWNFASNGRLTPVASPRSQDICHVEHVSCILLFQSSRTRADDVQDQLDLIKRETSTLVNQYIKIMAAKLDPHASSQVTHQSPLWYTEPLVPRLRPRLQFPELEFNSTMWRGRKTPVYSLTDLLGEEKASALITASKYKREKCVVISRARHNVPVEILLMQLHAYLALPRS